ncbi:metal ABC transporter solute-binding protein, Zn/Mn family [Aureibacillus halotolerans]|uniref:Manganese/zinc/iron transport system substrate-binding protein n=1 Tax=Aureibacillus halotolerans TaxID=1508390 RepID=A0A4R6U7U4_9BACI|nr:zinc ABC transporter substrate-binding protein [Aureibacillus halotolerans]TDQ42598.1 manganese/zinc/iron transport system substrate-binding protein [Aureibacillus halotolerans]
MNHLNRWVLSFVCLTSFALLVGCSSSSTTNEKGEGPISIVTTIAQIGEPLQRIGGDLVDVTSIMGPGVDPHTYVASQGDIGTLQQADLIFYNGLHLEGQMNEIFTKLGEEKPVLAVAEAIPEDQLLTDAASQGAPDPHVWFDISLWKIAISAAVEELKAYAPEHAETFDKNLKTYIEELDALQQEASSKLAKIPESKRLLVTAHDAFGYFGRAFDIEVVGLQGLSTEDEIGLSDIQKTVDTIVEAEVPAVFIETSINTSSIQAVIEGAEQAGAEITLGGELFSDAMGEAGTPEGTYLGMYTHNVDTIYTSLAGGE